MLINTSYTTDHARIAQGYRAELQCDQFVQDTLNLAAFAADAIEAINCVRVRRIEERVVIVDVLIIIQNRARTLYVHTHSRRTHVVHTHSH